MEISLAHGIDASTLPLNYGFPIANYIIDFNGNGKSNIINGSQVFELNNVTNNFEVIYDLTIFPNYSFYSYQYTVVDVNGDGLQDILFKDKIYYSTGKDFILSNISFDYSHPCVNQPGGHPYHELVDIIPSDINNNGKIDLIAVYHSYTLKTGEVTYDGKKYEAIIPSGEDLYFKLFFNSSFASDT